MRLFGKEKQSEQGRRDEALRRKLEGHELTPPSYLWEAIEEKLPETKRRRPGTLLYYVLPVAACLVAAISVFMIKGTNDIASGTERIAGKPAISKQDKTYDETPMADQRPADLQVIVNENPVAEKNRIETGKSFTLDNNYTGSSKKINPLSAKSGESVNDPGQKSPIAQPGEGPEKYRPIAKNPPAADKPEIPFTISDENTPKEDKENIAILNDTAANEEKNPKQPEAPAINPLVNNKPKSAAGKWMAGLRISPASSFRYATALTMDEQVPPPSMSLSDENLANHETPGTGLGIALLGKYSLSKKVWLVTGLEYNTSSINSYIRVNYYQYVPDSPSMNVVYGEFVETSFLGDIQNKSADNYDFEPFPGVSQSYVYREKLIPAKYHFRAFEIPMELRAEFTSKKIGWFIEGGPRLRFLQSYFVKVYDDQMGTWPKSSLSNIYNTVQASAHLHTGLQIPFSKFTLETGPHFNTMLSALDNQQKGKTRLYQAGVSLSAWYRF